MLSRRFSILAIVLFMAAVAVAQTIPAGTRITVRTGSELSSGTAKAGETWSGTLAKDLVVGGKTIAKSGTPVNGKVTSAKSSGRLHAPGLLSIRLTSIAAGDGTIAVQTASYGAKGKGHMKSNATKIGGGAVAGAIIGAIAGGGKGAAIGTLVGAGAGTGVAAATGKEEAVIHAESLVTFTTTAAARKKK